MPTVKHDIGGNLLTKKNITDGHMLARSKGGKTNLKNLGIDSFVYEGDFKQLLKKQPPEKYDFIYIDPPYAGDHAQTALEMIAEKKLLKKDEKIASNS